MPHLFLYAPGSRLRAVFKEAIPDLEIEWAEVESFEELSGQIEPPALALVPMRAVSIDELSQLRERLPRLDVAILSSRPTIREATEVIRAGAVDYLPGKLDPPRLRALVERWFEQQDLLEERRHLSEIITLMDLGQTLTSMLRLDGLYDQIIELVARAFVPDTVSLMLLNPRSERLRLVAARGLSPSAATGTEVSIDDSIAGYVLRNGQPQLLLGGLERTRFEHVARQDANIGSAMSVPLKVQGRTLGVLNVTRHRGHPNYTEADANLLHVFAAQIAIAVQNAQLYESLREERDRILEAQETVRRELARDLHDGLTQMLATLAISLDYLGGQVRDGRVDLGELPSELESLRATARQAIHDARTMTFGMRPLVLETRGLVAALRQYLDAVAEGDSRTRYHLDFDPRSLELDPDLKAARTIFAILQEAINNARKHANADNIWVSIHCGDENGKRVLISQVRDDGGGFDVSQVEGDYEERYSFGLLNMKERSTLIDADYSMESGPTGTTVRVVLPLAN